MGGVPGFFLIFRRSIGLELCHVKFFSIAAAAAQIHAVGLIQLAVIFTVVALQERFFYAFHCEIQSPVFSVYRDIYIAAKGRGHSCLAHHLIGQIILHVGVVLNDIIQTELIQSVIGVGAVKAIEFNLEAVAVIAVGFHLRQRGVALGANSDILIGFIVNDDSTGRIFLAFTTFDKFVPIVHTDINCMHNGGGKELILISHDGGSLFYAKTFGIEKKNS